MKAETICQRVLDAYPDAQLHIEGEACNFTLTVVSPAFAGQTPIQRQRPILALFKEEIASGALHALTLVAKTPDEAALP